jgi:preprotein translocase subunit SecB
MTDPAPAEAAASPVQVTVHSQYIKDFSFESPNAPQVFGEMAKPPALEMTVNVLTRQVGENASEVTLLLKLEATVEGKKAFIAELAYAGVFALPPLPANQLQYILLVEGPRLLFPFARNIIAGAVRDGGFPQLLIAPMDFAAMYQAQAAQMNQPAAGTA